MKKISEDEKDFQEEKQRYRTEGRKRGKLLINIFMLEFFNEILLREN